MIAFKEGVSVKGLEAPALLALLLVDQVRAGLIGPTFPTTVTSANDGTHLPNSFHYDGLALDFRTHGCGMSRTYFESVQKVLAPLGYVVILEDEGGDNEHIHVQFGSKH